MSYTILGAVQKRYGRFGIFIPPDRNFIPGKDCKGEKPFKKSDKCYKICFGTHGASSVGGLPLPCEAMTVLNKQFMKKTKQAVAKI